jgi:hypothetical protein
MVCVEKYWSELKAVRKLVSMYMPAVLNRKPLPIKAAIACSPWRSRIEPSFAAISASACSEEISA